MGFVLAAGECLNVLILPSVVLTRCLSPAWTYFSKFPADKWWFKALVTLCVSMCIGDTVATGRRRHSINMSLELIFSHRQVCGLTTGLSQITRVSLEVYSTCNLVLTTFVSQIPPHWRSPIGRLPLNLSSCETAAVCVEC